LRRQIHAASFLQAIAQTFIANRRLAKRIDRQQI